MSRACMRMAIGLALAGGLGALSGCADTEGGGEHASAPVNVPPQIDDASKIQIAQNIAFNAQTLERNGQIDQAIAEYHKAIEIYRSFPAAWINMGVLLMNSNRNLEADEAFTIAGDLSPTDPRPPTYRGILWERLDYLDQAATYFSAALERNANYLPALEQAVRVDHLRQVATEMTSDRIRRALLLETDAKWREFLLGQKLRVDEQLKALSSPSSSSSSSPSPAPTAPAPMAPAPGDR